MLDRLRWMKRLVLDLPQQLRLAYCLFRDPRVPVAAKAGVAAALGLAVGSPVELPEGLPLVGELDVVAVALLALRVFVAVCPSEVVAEQEQLIADRSSRFDADVLAGERVALAVWERIRPQRPVVVEAA